MKRQMCRILLFLLFVNFFGYASAATVTVYTTPATYNAALPASGFASTFEDFSSVVANTLMSTGAGDVWNGFSVARTGTGVFGNSGYCPALSDPQASVPTPCVGYNANAPNVPGIVGSYAATTAPPATVTFTPTNEIFSFSFNHIDWNDSSLRSDFTVFMSDGTSQLVSGVLGGLPGFMGLIIDQTSREAGVHITSILWEGITSELVGYWDIGTNYLEPEINTTKTFGAITANADFTIDVPITIEVENSGQLNVNNLQVSDVLNAATNFAGAYTPSTAAVTTGGIISGPTVSVVDDGSVLTATAPTLNTAFDGSAANSTILNGTTGALGPGDTLVINFTVRLDLTAGAGTYQNLSTANAEAPNGNVVGDDSGAAAGGPGSPTPLIVPVLVGKSFAPDPIDEGDTSVLTISIRNPNASVLTGVSITDTYPAGDIINATPASGISSCGGTVTAADGGANVALSGATIPALGGCTITVNVTSNVAGTHTNTTGPVSTNESPDSATATDDLTVNAAPVPVCPAGSTLTAQVGNAVVATETGNVANPGQATAAIEAVGTNASTANSALLRNANDELILDLGEIVPTNGVVTISIARQQNAASLIIEDSDDGVAYSGGQVFNAGPNAALQRISYVVTAAAGARFIRFTNQNASNMWVDGVEYSQICDIPPPPPVCPAGSTLTGEVGNAVLATQTGTVVSPGLAAGAIEAVGTTASNLNSARLRNANDELVLDLGEVAPTNSVVSISIARFNTNGIVLIEDSTNGVAYSGGQFFGNGPNTTLQRIDYIVTAAAGAQFIRFTLQDNNDIWVDGVEYSQICDTPPPPPVCPAGTTLTAQVGNAESATENGAVLTPNNAVGALQPLGTNATAANSARLRNANDELILDLGELVPTNSVVTISIARLNNNAIVSIEDSEDGVAYTGGQFFGNGPNTALQRIDYIVTAAAGAQYIRFTLQDAQDMWVDGIEYSEICDAPDVVDLSITKDDGSATYTPGGTTTYTIVVTNNGPDDVAGVTIADDLPDGVTMTGPWTCTPSTANSSCNTAPNITDPIAIDVDIVNGDFITVTIPVQFSTNMSDY